MNKAISDPVRPSKYPDESVQSERPLRDCHNLMGNMSGKEPDSDQASVWYKAVDSIHQSRSIAGALRIVGAFLLVLSLSLFLIQGFQTSTDLQRYFLLLGQTVLLTVAGFAVGYLLKEPRGARVFFGLGLLSIPANFAVLGAMIYSLMPMDTLISSYPGYATWQSSSTGELLLAGIAGAVVLIPMALFCFAIFARQDKGWLSLGLLLSSSMLLIPSRSVASITVLSSIAVVAMIVLSGRLQTTKSGISTREMHFAQALLFVPPLLMLGRSAMFYSVDTHFALALLLSLYYLLRRAVARFDRPSRWAGVTQLAAVFLVVTISATIASLISTFVPVFNATVVYSLMCAILLLEFARHVNGTRLLNVMQIVWSLSTLLYLTNDYLIWNGPANILTSLMVAAGVMACGVLMRHVFCTFTGFLAVVVQIAINSRELITIALESGWLVLAVTGTGIIVFGSLIERFGPRLQLRWRKHGNSAANTSQNLEQLSSETAT